MTRWGKLNKRNSELWQRGRSGKVFPRNEWIVNILGSACCMVSVLSTELCFCAPKSAIGRDKYTSMAVFTNVI